MLIPFDIETIPDQREGAKERFIEESVSNFKAPSDLTKTQAAIDLNVTDAKELKATSKDQMISQWVEEFKGVKAESLGVENWRNTALDGSQGCVFSIAYEAEGVPFVVYGMDEKGVLNEFNDLLFNSLSLGNGIAYPHFVGHNISGFDLKFIWRRFVINGIYPKFSIPHNGRHGNEYFDNMVEWCGYKGRISQDNLCKALGIEGKPDDIDGSKVWDFVEAGEHKRVAEYNQDDAAKVAKVHKRLTFTAVSEREEIKSQVDDFLSSGGEITELSHSDSGDNRSAKDRFNDKG